MRIAWTGRDTIGMAPTVWAPVCPGGRRFDSALCPLPLKTGSTKRPVNNVLVSTRGWVWLCICRCVIGRQSHGFYVVGRSAVDIQDSQKLSF